MSRNTPHRFGTPVFLIALACALTAGFATGCGRAESPSHSGAVADSQQEVWSCSMHPQVIEHEAGPCPICGMAMTRVGSAPAAPAAKAAAGSGDRKIAYWVAPMDPSFVSNRPGKSPMGMDLVPVYQDELADGGKGLVTIDPVVVQNMGVRLDRVRRQPLFRHVRTLGEVVVAEDLVSVVNLRFSGWVEKIHVDKTGDLIERGETLLEVYSPDLVAAQDEYLLAIRAQGADSSLARSARRKLALLGLDDSDIDAVARSGRTRRALPIRAPRSGHVLHKNVVEGARIPAGQDLYTIADLSRIWVQAEVYEYDAPWVELGQPAQMELTYQRGRTIEGSVAYVYPTLNEVARTLTVRLEFPNPDLRLKPGMFATVYIQFRREDDALAVPTQSILHSGRREIVFVSLGAGRFSTREITTGLVGDRHMTQVLSGLEEGEVVVTSGQFLIDSESQLQEAIEKMLARRSGSAAAGTAAEEKEQTVYACPMHPEQTSHEPGRCPLCGMDLEPRVEAVDEGGRAHAPALVAEHGEGEPAAARYVCPLHPHVDSGGPGRCPVDGTFLEKREPMTHDHEEGPR